MILLNPKKYFYRTHGKITFSSSTRQCKVNGRFIFALVLAIALLVTTLKMLNNLLPTSSRCPDWDQPRVLVDSPIPQFEGCTCGDDKAKTMWATYRDSLASVNSWVTCSDPRSNASESGQLLNVASYSLYKAEDKWLNGVEENAKIVQSKLKNWQMWLYHDVKSNSSACKTLCKIRQRNAMLSLCFVENFQRMTYSFTDSFQRLWRFLPIADSNVDVMLSRDLDSRISDREIAAVIEWLKSDKTLHTMRDHKMHNVPILAGMWGINKRATKNRDLLQMVLRCLLHFMLEDSQGYTYDQVDQVVLANIIWPHFLIANDYLDHASHFCQGEFGSESVGFPTERESSRELTLVQGSFVGQPVYGFNGSVVLEECPVACRRDPKWIHC